MLEACHTCIVIVDSLNAMGLTCSKAMHEIQKQCSHQPISQNPAATGAAQNSCGDCFKSHVLARPPALLKTQPGKVVNVKATGNQDAIVVKPPNNKRQSLLEDPEDTATSDEAEGKKTKRQMQFMWEMTMTPNVMKLELSEWHSMHPQMLNG